MPIGHTAVMPRRISLVWHSICIESLMIAQSCKVPTMRSQIEKMITAAKDWQIEDLNGFESAANHGRPAAEETLVSDYRAEMRPADFVESKLQRALRDSTCN